MKINLPNEEKIDCVNNIIHEMNFHNLKFDTYEKFDIPLSTPFDTNSLVEDEYFILYFDILGYKEKIKKYEEEFFLKIMYAVIDTINVMYEGSKKSRSFGYHIFSDNVIIFIRKKIDTEDNILELFNLIQDTFIIQRNLMGHYRILIRGAITEGKLYYGGNFVYGSGLVNSYLLEDKKSINPRVIIDKNLIKQFKGNIPDNSVTKEICININQLINQDDDGEFFVGYINYFEKSCEKFVIYLFYHKKLIESLLEESALKEEIRQKIIWCKKYHNLICRMYQLENMKIL